MSGSSMDQPASIRTLVFLKNSTVVVVGCKSLLRKQMNPAMIQSELRGAASGIGFGRRLEGRRMTGAPRLRGGGEGGGGWAGWNYGKHGRHRNAGGWRQRFDRSHLMIWACSFCQLRSMFSCSSASVASSAIRPLTWCERSTTRW